jgi:NitT/TauT family transport system substrate-binding protein
MTALPRVRGIGVAIVVGFVALACSPATAPPAAAPPAVAPPAAASKAPAASAAAPAPAPTGAPASEPVRVGISSRSTGFLNMFVAQRAGIFTSEGFDAELVPSAIDVQIAALLSGEMDYIGSITSAMTANSRGAPIKVIAAGLYKPLHDLVAVPSVTTVAALRGQRIGIARPGGADYYSAVAILHNAGLKEEVDVDLVGAGGAEDVRFEQVKMGTLPATVVSPPFSVLAAQQGLNLVVRSSDISAMPIGGLAASTAKLESQPNQVTRMVRATLKSLQYVHENRAGTIEVIQREFDLSPEDAAASYDRVVSSVSPDGRFVAEGIRQFSELAQGQGLLPEGFDGMSAVDYSALDRVR